MEDELSDTKKAAPASINTDMKTGTTGYPKKLNKVPEVKIYKDSDRKEEPNPKLDIKYKYEREEEKNIKRHEIY